MHEPLTEAELDELDAIVSLFRARYGHVPRIEDHDVMFRLASIAPRLLHEIRTLRDQHAWLAQRDEEHQQAAIDAACERDVALKECERLRRDLDAARDAVGVLSEENRRLRARLARPEAKR
jgi:hypothetical protein